jgi:TetR/AcrR family transcriptional regulator
MPVFPGRKNATWSATNGGVAGSDRHMSKAADAPPARPRGRPGKSRPALLNAAIREFAEKGYEGATTAGIARRAKSNQPLVHHYFGSKEELFRVVLDVLFAELREALVPGGGAPDGLGEMLRRLVLFTARRPELARIWMIESARRGRHATYVLEKHIVPIMDLMRPLLGAAARNGALPAVDAMMLLYAIQGLACYPFLIPEQVRRLSGRESSSSAFAEEYAEAVLAILRLRAT